MLWAAPTRRGRAMLAVLSLALVLAVPAAAAQPEVPWTTLLAATFKILAMLPELPVSCTGWFAAPSRQVSSMHVSVYITAGHCPVPQVIRTAKGLEQMAVLARITRPGVDATVGLRLDPRSLRTFPVLATKHVHAGDRSLVAGYSAGHLTEAVLTAIDGRDCPVQFLCFHSDQGLHPGISGAPILSLRTGDIVGILVATAQQARGYEDPHTIMATPAGPLRALVEIAAPGALQTDLSVFRPASGTLLFWDLALKSQRRQSPRHLERKGCWYELRRDAGGFIC